MFKHAARILITAIAVATVVALSPAPSHAAVAGSPVVEQSKNYRCDASTGDATRTFTFSPKPSQWVGVRARIGVTIHTKSGKSTDTFNLRRKTRTRTYTLPAREYATLTVTVNGRFSSSVDIAPKRACWNAHVATLAK